MEVLEVSGYVSEEKAVIAERYLAPQAKDASGLAAADVQLERDTVDVLIKYYCRESGVRNLKKHIDKVGVVHQMLKPELLSRRVVDISEGCPQNRAGPWRGDVPRA
jgi:ATP-dependent Lon protease